MDAKTTKQKEISATMTILNQTTEATANLYIAYESVNGNSDDSKKDKTYNKKQTHKIESQPKNIRMGKLSKIATSFIDIVNHVSVYREQRREARRERSKKRLFD
jgi:hypothetical protein